MIVSIQIFLVIWGRIHSTSFSNQLTNRPNKLECYKTLGWKYLPVASTLTYWSNSKTKKKLCVMNTMPVVWQIDICHLVMAVL